MIQWLRKVLSSFAGGTLTGAVGGKIIDLTLDAAREQVEELSKDKPHNYLDRVLTEMGLDPQFAAHIAVIDRRFQAVMGTKREDLWETALEAMLLDADGKTFDMGRAVESLCVLAALSDGEFDRRMRMRIDSRPDNLKQRAVAARDAAATTLIGMTKTIAEKRIAVQEENELLEKTLRGTRTERRAAEADLAAYYARQKTKQASGTDTGTMPTP